MRSQLVEPWNRDRGLRPCGVRRKRRREPRPRKPAPQPRRVRPKSRSRGRLLLVHGGRLRRRSRRRRRRFRVHRRAEGEPDLRRGLGGNTGHFEAIAVRFDPSKITLCARFWTSSGARSIPPTPAGSSPIAVRSTASAIFFQNAEQRTNRRGFQRAALEASHRFRQADRHDDPSSRARSTAAEDSSPALQHEESRAATRPTNGDRGASRSSSAIWKDDPPIEARRRTRSPTRNRAMRSCGAGSTPPNTRSRSTARPSRPSPTSTASNHEAGHLRGRRLRRRPVQRRPTSSTAIRN